MVWNKWLNLCIFTSTFSKLFYVLFDSGNWCMICLYLSFCFTVDSRYNKLLGGPVKLLRYINNNKNIRVAKTIKYKEILNFGTKKITLFSDASFQAKAWIQALAIYFHTICLSFLCTTWKFLDSFQAHLCFLYTGNPVCYIGIVLYQCSYNESPLYSSWQFQSQSAAQCMGIGLLIWNDLLRLFS